MQVTLVTAVVLAAFVPGVDAAEPPVTDLDRAGAKALKLEGDWIASGAGAVWLSDPPNRQVFRLDGRTGNVVRRISVPQGPCQSSVTAADAFWTATCGMKGLARIDPGTNRVSGFLALPVGPSEGSIGGGAGSVWVAIDGQNCSTCRIARVDGKTLKVLKRIRVRDGATSVRVGAGAVWVVNPQKDLVQKIDPRRNRVAATTKVGPSPRFFAVGMGGVWTLNQEDGTVTRLDARTAKVVATIRADVVGEGGDLTVGSGWVWARGQGYLLSRIDPKTNRVVERYGPSSGSGGVVVGFGAVWISAHDVGTVWRLPLSKI